MSYSQIFRRVHRLLKTVVNDAVDALSPEEQELADFDEALRGAAQDAGPSARTRPAGPSAGGSTRARQSSTGQTGGSSADPGARNTREQGQGGARGAAGAGAKRKPGEKDDAYYYAVLGLTPSATVEDVKRAYKMLMRRYHPDRVATLSAAQQRAATVKAQSITEAYHIISRRKGFS
ncbi:MAG: J domain-containing protein [Ignavibacteriae bacterium]|nr:J domain-containing protein [Ignavibacteriota bacterium]